MIPTWDPGDEQVLPRQDTVGWARFAARFVPMAIVTFGGLGVLMAFRILERPLFGAGRPVTPWITQAVCRTNMAILGVRTEHSGAPMRERGALVANHGSWLDIYSLNARARIYFVAKHEVARWFGIGWLARATGTEFVERRRGAAKAQHGQFMARLEAGHRLLFFPEGTSTDGRRVLPFKSTLFEAFFDRAHRDHLWIQPVSVVYTAPEGREERFFGWWGDMEFGPHFLAVLSAPRGGRVRITFHDPLKVSDFPDRKAMAQAAEERVRAGVDGYLSTRS